MSKFSTHFLGPPAIIPPLSVTHHLEGLLPGRAIKGWLHSATKSLGTSSQGAATLQAAFGAQCPLTFLVLPLQELKNLNHAFDNAVMEYKNEESTGQMQF